MVDQLCRSGDHWMEYSLFGTAFHLNVDPADVTDKISNEGYKVGAIVNEWLIIRFVCDALMSCGRYART